MPRPRESQSPSEKLGNAVVSVRMPHEYADALQEVAIERGVPMSALVREAIEAYLQAGHLGTSSTHNVSISSPSGAPVMFYARPTSIGRSAGSEAVIHAAETPSPA